MQTDPVARFFAALTFFTILPGPRPAHERYTLEAMAPALPFVGLLIGACGATLLAIGSFLFLSAPLAALIAIAGMVALTGALHEDGLADFFDGLGAHDQKARAAAVHDPRLGAFGVLALVFALALRVALLAVAIRAGLLHATVTLLVASVWSRAPLIVLAKGGQTPPGSRLAADCATFDKKSAGLTLVLAALVTFPLILMTPILLFPASLLVVSLALAGLRRVAQKAYGGVGGDTYGTAQQISETILLAAGAMAAAHGL